MKGILMLIMAASLMYLMMGCEDLLTFNLFSSFDTPKTPSADTFDAMTDGELIDEVTVLLESDTFLEDISQDDEIKSAVVGNLTEIYADGSESDLEDQQRAALLVAEIALETTAAGDVADDFVNVLTEYIENPPVSGDPGSIAETMVGNVFSRVTAENFDETLDALLAAADAYTFYGETLDDSGEVIVPDGINSAAVAQDAVVTILITDMLDLNDNQPDLLSVDELRAIVVDGAPFPSNFAIAEDPMQTDEALVNILDASDLQELFSA